MDTIDKQLEDFQSQREKLEADMAGVNEALMQAQNKLREHQTYDAQLAAEMASMQALKDNLSANRQTVETEWASVTKAVKTAKAFHTELLTRVKTAVPADRQKAIRRSIEEVEKQLNDNRQLVDNAQVEAAAAEAALSEAQRRLLVQETNYNNALTELYSLPAQIQISRDRLIRIEETAKTIAADDPVAEALALYFADELERNLANFKTLTDPGKYQALEEKVFAEWQKQNEVRADVSKKATQLEHAKDSLLVTRDELERKVQERETDIRRALSSIARKTKA